MSREVMSSKHKFWRNRLVHFRPQYEQPPGRDPSADWRDSKLSRRQRILRRLFYKVQHSRPSAPGFSKLPAELRMAIFQKLCGNELRAVRLVCREWELVSRPFFAEWYLQRSLFWLTGADLKRLESLARRFGPWMGTIYITTDHFTLSRLRAAWRRYEEHRDYLRQHTSTLGAKGSRYNHQPQPSSDEDHSETSTQGIGTVRQPLQAAGSPGSSYFRHAYAGHESLSPWRFLRFYAFLWHYFCNTITQGWTASTGQDQRTLARIAERLPEGNLEAVEVGYSAKVLNWNVYAYGRAAPRFAMELTLLCGDSDGGGQVGLFGGGAQYGVHVRRVVGEAMAARAR